MERIAKFQYKIETDFYNKILREECSNNSFHKNIVSRVYTLGISVLSLFSLALKLADGIYELAKGLTNPKKYFSAAGIEIYLKQLVHYVFAVAVGSVVGLLEPEWGRRGFLDIAPQTGVYGTSEGIEATRQDLMNEMYEMADHVHKTLEKANIRYCCDCGMVLGYMRHKDQNQRSGFIPWDDDLDIAIHLNDKANLEALKETLEANGKYRFKEYRIGFMLELAENKYGGNAPATDIYLVNNFRNDGLLRPCQPFGPSDEKLVYGTDLEDDTEIVDFGPTQVRMLKKEPALQHLDRAYGSDWNSVVFKVRDHIHQTGVKPTKVELRDKERLPAPYTGSSLDKFTPKALD